MRSPTLQFHFQSSIQQFSNPINVWQAEQLDEIAPIFNEIEAYLDEGYYIAGFVSYEAAPAFDASYMVHSNQQLPLVWFAAFNEPSNHPINHITKDYELGKWQYTTDYKNYQRNITNIKDAIAAGNTYQVNYTTRLKAPFVGDPYSFYQQLAKNQRASYSAYLDIGDTQILSASPELFFHVKDGNIVTKPMKGTIKRGRTYQEDIKLQQQLRQSEKDQAENVMIVDLLRNDIGRIAKPGTVNVTSLFDVETYPTVHQMTSSITAQLETSKVFDWFQALFPCGSITGAPKVETMKYIAQLEDTPREVYCGAIGWISPQREAIFNVPIRTAFIQDGVATYGAGGGITWDSISQNEYDELNQKAEILRQNRQNVSLIESLKLEDGQYPLLPYHMKRLKESTYYFGYPFNKVEVEEKLQELATTYKKGIYKIRLLYHSSGDFDCEHQLVPLLKGPIQSAVATTPIDCSTIYLYHKTTNRQVYEWHDQQSSEHVFTTLLWNKEGFITEFTLGNIVIEKNGYYYTPPVTDGLLAGTFRGHLVENKTIIEKQLRLSELKDADQIWFINSVRGWLKVQINVDEEKQKSRKNN
ncbi:aminodeoxychorismate synthase component I [Gracilibacillus sp. S3-1-1]|uniref:Aminodeoxychorismate synthase component I n=1 Tax=Gracilibacillus pellucidus TaxID=3095368 RepID=A0ACC6M189_9BACI|nr:aminodeoxychorismate synthase component I [Gracilibacillus sp. S3-1-1]MDX8044699.1 aminodeoxychorismate synthase component I [Gracilibacillus sp. S3-1-1]